MGVILEQRFGLNKVMDGLTRKCHSPATYKQHQKAISIKTMPTHRPLGDQTVSIRQ